MDSYSLIKDGAFMICESASEYDPLVPEPEVEKDEAVTKELNQASEDYYSAVTRIMDVMEPIYYKYHALLTDRYVFQTTSEAYTVASDMMEQVSEVATKLRFMIIKLEGIEKYTTRTNWIIEDILPKVKDILMNKEKYANSTIEVTDYELSYEYMDELWNAMKEMAVYPYSEKFSNMDEIYRTIFVEKVPDKLLHWNKRSTDLRSFVRSYISTDSYPAVPNVMDGNNDLVCSMIKTISYSLKTVSRICYDITCNTTEESCDLDMVTKDIVDASKIFASMIGTSFLMILFLGLSIDNTLSRKREINAALLENKPFNVC